jgi:hypothetical protein
VELDGTDFKLDLEVEGKNVIRTDGAFSQSYCQLAGLPNKVSGNDCRDLSFEEMAAASDSLPLFGDADPVRRMFPNVFNLLADGQIAQLLVTHRSGRKWMMTFQFTPFLWLTSLLLKLIEEV